jgi:hypothetical protein
LSHLVLYSQRVFDAASDRRCVDDASGCL